MGKKLVDRATREPFLFAATISAPDACAAVQHPMRYGGLRRWSYPQIFALEQPILEIEDRSYH